MDVHSLPKRANRPPSSGRPYLGKPALTRAEITRRQATALGARLGVPAFVGMKHSPPFIATGAAEARAASVERLVGLPLAPHFARMSVGQYEAALVRAWSGGLEFVAA